MSSYVLDLLIIWLCTYLKRTEFTPVYDKCGWSIGGPEERTCPKYDTSHWQCLALEKNCLSGTDYHCAKDLMTGSWKEMCDEMKLCHAGEEPQIIDNKVRCGYCQDVEKYNPATNTPSHKFSDCPKRKTKCIPEQNGRVECDEAYDRMDTNSRYKMDRHCRCYYEKNYMPSFYDVEHDTWKCIVAFQLDCVLRPCPETEDGRTQRRHEDYRCYPEQDVISTTDVSVKSWSALETKPHTMTPTRKKPLKLTSVTTLEKTNDKPIQEPDSLMKVIIPVVIIVFILAVVIVCIVKIMKGKENGQVTKNIWKTINYIRGNMFQAETLQFKKDSDSSDAEDYHNKPMCRPPNDGSTIEKEPLNPNADGVPEIIPVADSYSDTSDVNDNSDDKKNSVSNFLEIEDHNNDPGSVNVPIEYDKKQPGPGQDQDSVSDGSNFKPLNLAQQDKKITDKDDQVHFIDESKPSMDVISLSQHDKQDQESKEAGDSSTKQSTDPPTKTKERTDVDDLVPEVSEPELIPFNPVNKEWQEKICQELSLTCCSFHEVVESKEVRISAPPKLTKLIQGDGNCFFRTVSFLITGSQESHEKLRDIVVQYLDENSEKFMTIHSNENYVSATNMDNVGEWATDVEIIATASLLATDIYVYASYGKSHKWIKYEQLSSFNHIKRSKQKMYISNISEHFVPVLEI